MTDKPTPTDAELEALLLDKLPASKHYLRPVIEKMVAAMQAAIDKWGTQQESTESNESAYQRGYMDGMAKGRRDAETAPQQEAQEPVATLHCNDIGYVWVRATEVGTRMRFEQPLNLYTAPQPSPAPLSDDTERLEWLLWKLPGDALRYVVGELADTSSGSEFRAAIDAAIAAQGGK